MPTERVPLALGFDPEYWLVRPMLTYPACGKHSQGAISKLINESMPEVHTVYHGVWNKKLQRI